MLSAALLRLLHAFYSLYLIIRYVFYSLRRPTSRTPGNRLRIPKNLALLLVPDPTVSVVVNKDAFLLSLKRAVDWCSSLGVETLTVHDSPGFLKDNGEDLYREFRTYHNDSHSEDTSEDDIAYPLTPPPSDYSESRPRTPDPTSKEEPATLVIQLPGHSPENTGSHLAHPEKTLNGKLNGIDELTLNFSSKASAQPHMAKTAMTLARLQRRHKLKERSSSFSLSINTLESVLEGPSGISPPEFMIVHSFGGISSRCLPLELHSFPPWQIRLTEIWQNCRRRPGLSSVGIRVGSPLLEEPDFYDALLEFSSSQQRFGR